MKLNVKLLSLDGEPILDEDNVAHNLLDLCILALTQAEIPKDRGVVANMGRRFRIATRLAAVKDSEEEIDDELLTNKDKVILMACLAARNNPLVVGRVAEIIDPALLKED